MITGYKGCEATNHHVRRPIRWIGRGLGLLFSFAAITSATAQTPAGTSLVSIVSVTYRVDNGEEFTVFADPADGHGEDFIVGRVASVALDAGTTTATDPGTTVTFHHLLANDGNAADTFAVTAHSRNGWQVRVYRDANGDGVLDANDPLVTGSIALAAESSAALWVAVTVPSGTSVRGVEDSVWLTGRSLFNPSVADSALDRVDVRGPGLVVALQNAVDRTTATAGDTLTYTITYAATGSGSATTFRITDAVPTGTTYLPGSLRLNGVQLTDGASDDAGTFDVANNRVVVALASIAAGDSGIVTFKVRVAP